MKYNAEMKDACNDNTLYLFVCVFASLSVGKSESWYHMQLPVGIASRQTPWIFMNVLNIIKRYKPLMEIKLPTKILSKRYHRVVPVTCIIYFIASRYQVREKPD